MTNVEKLSIKLTEKNEELALYKDKRKEIIKTGSSYSIKIGEDQRQLQNVSLAQLTHIIERLEKEIEVLENKISRGGSDGKTVILGARM